MPQPLEEPTGVVDPVAIEPTADGRRQATVLAVLLALVALTAALAAWRTSVVGSNSGDLSRDALIATVDEQGDLTVYQQRAYMEAEYAAMAAIEKAAGEAMRASDIRSLRATGATVLSTTVPGLEQIGGPFPQGGLMTDSGTFDVPTRVAQLQRSAEASEDSDPAESLALARTYSDEKQWLTVISVVLAVGLFWLGLAEISSGRWRTTNMLLGVAVWVVGLGGLAVVELAAASARGGTL